MTHLGKTFTLAAVIAIGGEVLVYGSIFGYSMLETNYQYNRRLVSENAHLTTALGIIQEKAQLEKPQSQKALHTESVNSLRRRTLRLVDDLEAFWDRQGSSPFTNPSTDDQRQKANEWYRRVTQAYVAAAFKERGLGIIREYKSKGINIGFLERAGERTPDEGGMWGAYREQECSPSSQSDLCQFRSLAYRVDAQDNLVVFKSE